MNKKLYNIVNNFICSRPGIIIGVILDLILIGMFIPILKRNIEQKIFWPICMSVFVLCIGFLGLIQAYSRAKKLNK